MTAHSGLTRLLAWAALLGIVFSLAVLLLMPLARPDLDLLRYPPSFYTSGPWATAQVASFVATGLASIAIAAALWRSARPSAWLGICVAALVVGGLSSMALGRFPMGVAGSTVIGDLHQTAGTIGGVAQLVAALALLQLTRRDPALHRLSRPAVIAFAVAVAGAVASQVALWWPRFDIPIGVTMRLVLAPLLLLWGLVAWLTLRDGASAPTRSSAVR